MIIGLMADTHDRLDAIEAALTFSIVKGLMMSCMQVT